MTGRTSSSRTCRSRCLVSLRVLPLIRAAAALLFESSGDDWKVVFQEIDAPEHDMRIVFYKLSRARTGIKMIPVGYIKHNSHRSGYICTTFLIALILATPVGWRRRGWALLYGMLLIHVLIALKVGILLLYGFNKEPFSVIVLSPFWSRALSLAYHVFIPNLTFSLIVSVFIWFLVSFRREEWAKLLMGKENSSRVKTKNDLQAGQ